MLNSFHGVKIEFPNDDVSRPILSPFKRSITLGYHQSCNLAKCFPYKITLQYGLYQFECWGAKGSTATNGLKPGLGAYTSGVINITEEKTFYVFIGATGYYNALIGRTSTVGNSPQGSGGSTDVRLNDSERWYDKESLVSRIMVAAGGGSAEWLNSIGGNGGELEGGKSISAQEAHDYCPVYDEPCLGANQTSSQECPVYNVFTPVKGGFGYAGNPITDDDGGFGGNGYYGGTSYPLAFAGSGGSSFISGHKGCKAIKDPLLTNNEIVHKEDSIHYSGIFFNQTKMIAGNKTMPIPNGNYGIWDDINGKFRLTYLLFPRCTCKRQRDSIPYSIIFAAITSIFEIKD